MSADRARETRLAEAREEIARVPSFEDMLRDPNEQFDLRSELLASIDRYMNAPSATMSVPSATDRERQTWLAVTDGALAETHPIEDHVGRDVLELLRATLDHDGRDDLTPCEVVEIAADEAETRARTAGEGDRLRRDLAALHRRVEADEPGCDDFCSHCYTDWPCATGALLDGGEGGR